MTSTPLRSARHRPDERGPAPFTPDDFAARMTRAAASAQQAGLAGVLVTPGPDLLYLSGITLAVMASALPQRLPALLERVRTHGGKVAFDNNYRACLWPGGAAPCGPDARPCACS